MKLLMIAPEEIPVPPPSGGSVENCMIQIATRWKKKHSVTIVSRRHPKYPNVTKSGNLTILRVPSGAPMKYLSNVLHRVRGQRYDRIQVDNRPRYLAPLRESFPQTPISLFLHSVTFVSPPRLSAQQGSNLLAKADLVVGNSRSLKKRLSTLFPRHKARIRYVHLGVDVTQFRPPSAKERKKVRVRYGVHGNYNVIFAGRLNPGKGITTLIKAIHRLQKTIPNVRLIVAGGVGSKSYIRSLRTMVKTRGISCTFLGKVLRKRMHEVYWMGDCFVCPSQRHEAFGLVNVEALASGIPVVASHNGGIREIIRHGNNGLLVKGFNNPDNFAKSILKVKRNRYLAKRRAFRGRKDAISRFSWSKTAGALIRLYQ